MAETKNAPKKTYANDDEAFAALEEASQKGELNSLTTTFLSVKEGESISVKITGIEEFETDQFGKQSGVVCIAKGGIKYIAPQAVIISTIEDMIEKKKITLPVYAKITGGMKKTSPKGEYQLMTIDVL